MPIISSQTLRMTQLWFGGDTNAVLPKLGDASHFIPPPLLAYAGS